MPIPFLFIAAAAATGTIGVGKSIKAGVDNKDAKNTNQRAENIVKSATKKIETCRENCGKSIDDLGTAKIDVLDSSIKPFIQVFEKIKSIELEESDGLNELQKMILDKKEFQELKELQGMAASMAGGVASGAMAGAVTAFGAWSAAGTLASASTGTAIAALSGAAKANATLAFFGGGAKAVGGLGMLGGSAVLGGLIAGPALAVLGVVVGAKASANKEKAYSNLAKAKEYEEEMNAASDLCIGIRKRSNMFRRFLLSLNSVFDPLIYEMNEIVERSGCDYRDYNKEERETVAKAMALAGAIKTILDTPILDEDGNLTAESEKVIDTTKEKLNKTTT